MTKVLKDESNFILTNDELIEEVNYQLNEGDRVSKPTYERWVRQIKEGKADTPEKKAFVDAVRAAFRLKKKTLFKKMTGRNPNGWQRYAWVLERQYDELNLRIKQEHTGQGGKDLFANKSDEELLEMINELKEVTTSLKNK